MEERKRRKQNPREEKTEKGREGKKERIRTEVSEKNAN